MTCIEVRTSAEVFRATVSALRERYVLARLMMVILFCCARLSRATWPRSDSRAVFAHVCAPGEGELPADKFSWFYASRDAPVLVLLSAFISSSCLRMVPSDFRQRVVKKGTRHHFGSLRWFTSVHMVF